MKKNDDEVQQAVYSIGQIEEVEKVQKKGQQNWFMIVKDYHIFRSFEISAHPAFQTLQRRHDRNIQDNKFDL